MEFSLDTLVILFLSSGMLLIFLLWFYYDRRDCRLYDRQRISHVYYCVRCGHLYESKDPSEVCDCPKCSFRNGRLRF